MEEYFVKSVGTLSTRGPSLYFAAGWPVVHPVNT